MISPSTENQLESATFETTNYFEELIKTGKYDYYFERGQIVPGTVVSYLSDGVLIDVGAKSEAFVPNKEVADYAVSDPSTVLAISSEYDFYILRDEAGSGYDGRIVLSYKRVAQARSWAALEEKRNTEEILEARIQDVVKGGVVVEINGLRGFIPASHLRVKGGSNNPQLVGEVIPCTILEIDRQLGKLILSQKVAISLLFAEQRNALMLELIQALKQYEEKLAAGDAEAVPVTVRGEVVRITDFGAFVKIEDSEMDGLLPLSEISWRKVAHPSELLKIGDELIVQVLNVVPEQSRISLSLKRLEEDPWFKIAEKVSRNDVLTGTVNKITNFGVFIQLKFNDEFLDSLGFEALLPAEEISNPNSADISQLLDEFNVGEEIKVLILKVKNDERRITLSTQYIDKKGKIIAPIPEPEEQQEESRLKTDSPEDNH